MSSIIKLTLMDILAQNEQARIDYYDKCQKYYDGDHPLKVPEKYRQILQSEYGILVNYCEPIVEAPVSRLEIMGINCEDNVAKELLDRAWKNNNMAAKSIKIHRNAVKKGDAFVQVWPTFRSGEEKPTGYTISFLRPDIVFPTYSDDDDESLDFVKKQWVGFLNGEPTAFKWLFYHDKIQRFYSPLPVYNGTMTLSQFAGSAWIPYDPDGLGAEIVNPWGIIPIVHFKNKQDDSPFGAAELQNAFTVQDGINKLIVDLMRTADFQAFKQRWIAGVDEDNLPINEVEGGKKVLRSNPGDVWTFPDPEVRTGEFSEGDLTQILTAIDKMVDHLCAVTRTPKTALQDSDGTASSGFALQKIEAPLISKCKEMQTSFGGSWDSVNHILLTMAQYYGEIGKGDLPDTDILWQDLKSESPSDKLSDTQRKQILKQNRVISARQWAMEEGYTPEEIERMQEEIKLEGETAAADLLGHSFGEDVEE